MRLFLLLFLLAFANFSYGQTSDTAKIDTAAYVAPIFIGGEEEMFRHIERELFLSLSNFVKINEFGDNFNIRFKVDKFGDVIDIDVSSSSNPPINRYLVGIFTNMPKWTPGRIKGEKATLQMEYRLIIMRGADGFGYYVTKNEHTSKEGVKLNNKLKTVLAIVCVGLLVYLFTK